MKTSKWWVVGGVLAVGILVFGAMAWANSVASSTMVFQGTLTDNGDGTYSGTIPMTVGNYYVTGGGGSGISTSGGFDVFAEDGGYAYYDSAFQGVIGPDHDAYSSAGGWGDIYDPDCADYYNFSLELYGASWSLHHKGGGTQLAPTGGVPMGGTMDWANMLATETDTGAYDPLGPVAKDPGWAAANGGGAGTWDMDWNWGSEVIPLEWSSFWVNVENLGGGNYRVTLEPDVEGTIAVQDWYVPSSQLVLGVYMDPHTNALASGYQIADPFQINMLYQAGILDKDISNINTYLYPHDDNFPADHSPGTWALNYSDNNQYVFAIDEAGGLPVYTYTGAYPAIVPVYAPGIQWALTAWGQTILAGDIVEQGGKTYFRVHPEATYRPWVNDPPVNNVEVFSGNLKTEVEGYTFDGSLASVENGSTLTCGIPVGLPPFPVHNATQDTYYLAIHPAIDDADAGDTINVAAGTYTELIVIDKPLTLRGATAGVNKKGYAVPANYAWDDTVESIINHPNPSGGYITIVDIYDVGNVTFEGFVVQELDAVANLNSSLVRVYAHTREIDNIVVRNNIIGPNTNTTYQDGAQGRMGLYIVNHPYDDKGVVDSTFSGNKIFDCKGNGNNVFLWSSYYAYGASGPASMAGTVIEDNEICGSHRSGIETAGGFSGLTIRNNTIYGNSGPGDTPDLKYGNGILMIRGSGDREICNGYGPVNVTIEDNAIFDNEDHGIYMGPNNEGIIIVGNDIHDNGSDAVRVDLIGNYWNPDFDPEPGPYTCLGGSQNVTVSSNNIENNGAGVQVIGTPSNGFVLDATNNWWGDASGPCDPTGTTEVPPCTDDPTTECNIDGLGDPVTDNVDYCPWLISSWPYVEFAQFAIDHAKIDFKKKAGDDKIHVRGTLALDANGEVYISEDVTVTIGPLTQTIPIPMVEKGKKGDKWEYKRPKDGEGIIKHMTIDWKNGRFDIHMDKADLTGVTNPVFISIRIGDDVGSASILMREKKHHWDYKANKKQAVETEPFAIMDELKVVAYPNPIRDVNTATFQVMGTLAAEVEEIRVQIYDLSGHLVWEDAALGPELDWHTDSLSGDYLANGMYLYRVQVRIDGNWISQDIGRIAVLR